MAVHAVGKPGKQQCPPLCGCPHVLSPGGFTPHLAFGMGLVPSCPQTRWVLLTEVTQRPQTDVTMLLGTEGEQKRGGPTPSPFPVPIGSQLQDPSPTAP